MIFRREDPDGCHRVADGVVLLDDACLAVEGAAIVALDGALKNADRALIDAFVGTRDTRLGIHVVFVRDVPREVGGGEGDELAVVERLDALHVLIVHALAAVDGDALKRHGAAALAAVVAGFGDDLVRSLVHAVVLGAEGRARAYL